MSVRFPRRQNILTAIVLAIGALLVFFLPWRMPLTQRVISDSYNLGFNNMLAILGVGVTLLALVWLRQREIKSGEFSQMFAAHHGAEKLNVREILLVTGVAITGALFVWVAWIQLPLHYYSEIRWFIPSIELILLGRAPYTQFQWNYGPLFLYIPVWLVRISGGAIGADSAYIVSLLIFTGIGLVLLMYMTSVLTAGRRGLFFLMASVPFVFNISLGLNYTALRFVAPYAALLWLHSNTSFEKPLSAQGACKLGLVFAFSAMACFAISPESGLGFFLCALVYFIAWMRSQPAVARVLPIAAMCAGILASAIFLLWVSRDYFLSVLSFGSGGGNFPVFPSIYILFYLGTLAFVVPILAAYGLKNRSANAALALSWATLVTIFAAPALGRSDPGHIFCNGLGAFVGGAFLLQTSFHPARIYNRAYLSAFALLFCVGLPLIFLDHSRGPIGAVWQAIQNGERKPDRRFWNSAPSATHAQEQKFEMALKPFAQIGTPLGCDEQMEIFLKRTHRFVPEFFTPPAQNMLTENHVARKIESMRQMPIILVPATAIDEPLFQENEPQYQAWRSAFLSDLLLFPVQYNYQNSPLFAELEATIFVRRNFSVVRRMDSYYIMRRNPKIGPKIN